VLLLVRLEKNVSEVAVGGELFEVRERFDHAEV
jgi:hypothetical protein